MPSIPNGGGELAHRMPFDSPMTDITASASSSPDASKGRDKSRRRSLKYGQSLTTATQPQLGPPLLQVVTDFSETGERKKLGHKREDSLQERRKAKRDGLKGPIGSIKGANSRISGLSPSDRTLMIGIALQPETLDAQRGGLITKQPDNRKSITPEIIITPAALGNPWSNQDRNHRPRSSVYSQATQFARGISQFGPMPGVTVPPMPPIPSHALVPANKSGRPISAASWHTDFSDDGDREEICRRFSGESQLGILRHTSINTTATRRRSKGWWNTLLSPLLDRSNTLVTRNTAKISLEKKGEEKEGNMAFSPSQEAELEEEKHKSRSSIWTDLSRLDAQRQTLAFFNDSPTDVRRPALHHGEMVRSPEYVPDHGFGLAAEYYEASWHDGYSNTPFFECQGHDCSKKPFYRHGDVIGGPDGNYPLERGDIDGEKHMTGTANGEEALKDCDQTVVDRFDNPRVASEEGLASSGLPKSPRSPHVRNLSDSTDIDDQLDASSEIHESHSVATSKAASPMLDATSTARGLNLEDETHTPAHAVSQRALTPPPPKPSAVAKEVPYAINGSGVLPVKPPAQVHDPVPSPAEASPAVLTPGLQREFAAHNAIPMEATRSLPPPPSPPPALLATKVHDPLQINAPRAAPVPPQARFFESESASLDPLGANPANESPYGHIESHHSNPRDGLGIGGYRSSPQPPASVSVVNKNYGARANERTILEDSVPTFDPPPRSWPTNEKDAPAATTKEVREESPKKDSKKFALFCCIPKANSKKQKKQRILCCVIGGVLLGMIILILALILTLTIHRDDIPVQSSWFNISGFPPIPTGISTIAQPNAQVEFSQCVAPSTLWSCALPKEQQASIAPNQADQPNFRLEIRFQNGSSAISPNNSSNSSLSSRSLKPFNAVSAGSFVRHQLLKARDSFTSSLFTPNPAPPSQEDQTFLGNTTDNNTAPFAGEATPFFISFLPTTAVMSKRAIFSRQDSNSTTNSSDPFPDISLAIPPPSVNSDGTAAAANLLPYPSAQPLMLYNRGRVDEHYGFYTYFDRSIFVKSADLLNSTSEPNVPEDENGGAEEDAANVRCTWTQTRFLVQIWTNAQNAIQLLPSNSTNGTSSSISPATATTAASASATSNSALDFARPGSFPYPVSITMDRHGGDITKKMIYCYGMDDRQHIVSSEKLIHIENRAAGGRGLVNPAEGVFGNVTVSTADGGPGGIDGGIGGCQCQWRNWEST